MSSTTASANNSHFYEADIRNGEGRDKNRQKWWFGYREGKGSVKGQEECITRGCLDWDSDIEDRDCDVWDPFEKTSRSRMKITFYMLWIRVTRPETRQHFIADVNDMQ